MTTSPEAGPRARLLVSVRDAQEASLALAAGAHWIDVKEPANGPLGAASAETIAEVIDVVGDRAPLSVALGELADWEPRRDAIPRPKGGALVVKLGLSGCLGRDDWRARWRRAARGLPDFARLAAVIYADEQAAHAPAAKEILDAAGEIGCRAVLVDTFAKDGRHLFEHWTASRAARFTREVRRRGMLVVLAGSLGAESIELAVGCEPDLVAVRGAVCEAGRTSRICAARIDDLLDRLAAGRASEAIGRARPER